MLGSTTCSRLGCHEPAVALFSFDAREALAWIDPIDAGGGAGLLCGRHADRMSPPRGWNLIDRRQPELRLWIGITPEAAPLPPAKPGRHRRDRTVPAHADDSAGAHLPFDAPVAAPVEPAPSSVPVAAEAAPVPWSPHDRPAELERVLDARTPLLARAFDSARPAHTAD